MYGPPMAYALRAAKKKTQSKKQLEDGTLRWFTCKPCLVLWKDVTLSAHCFVCGRWGGRGKLVS